MSPEEQRIAIAEVCGWDGIFKDDDQVVCGHMPFQSRHTEWVENRPVPDYLNDANTSQELIDHLWEKGYSCVITHEGKRTDCHFVRRENHHTVMISRTGKASGIIAEAFLKTLGLWEESK